MKERTGRSILFFLICLMVLSSCEAGNGQRAAQGLVDPVALSGMPAESSPPPEPTPAQVLKPTATPAASQSVVLTRDAETEKNLAALRGHYSSVSPLKWGEHVQGVRTHLQTKENVIALTFDACGGKDGSGYDEKLIDFLIKEQIPATLFMNARWIDANLDTFAKLAANPLFEIENHGTEHRPLSVNGKYAYGIAGTKNVSGVIDEVENNADKIEKLTSRRPLFFRSGTAFYDEVAVQLVHDLGFQTVNYSVLGDAGATYNTEQVYKALMKARSGSIVLAHMNHPEKDTAEGFIKAIPVLQKAGFRFVQLTSYALE
jgi:peptidoglycan/xylan/chitin deacetylase (PgdA/CDA1 family)